MGLLRGLNDLKYLKFKERCLGYNMHYLRVFIIAHGSVWPLFWSTHPLTSNCYTPSLTCLGFRNLWRAGSSCACGLVPSEISSAFPDSDLPPPWELPEPGMLLDPRNNPGPSSGPLCWPCCFSKDLFLFLSPLRYAAYYLQLGTKLQNLSLFRMPQSLDAHMKWVKTVR